MRTNSFCLGIVVCLLAGFNAFGQQSPIQISANSDRDPADRELGVIQGQVLAEDGGGPLAKATLSLRSKGARPQDRPRTVRTDSRGGYAFRDLEAGQYVLRATRNGYIPRNYGQKTSYSFRREDVGTALTVGPGQVLDGIDFHLIRSGVVEGSVVDQDNEPVERVAVMLNGYRSLGGERRLLPFGRDETDDRGRFRIFGIPPGNYYLSVSPRPFIAYPQREIRSFPPTYYPGVLRVEEAASIEVTAGGEVGGFHLTVIEAFSYSVSGRVLTAEGKPAHSVWIMSRKESGKDVTTMMGPTTNTDLQGEFKVSGLLPGRHRLYARAGGGEDAQMTSATVDVADQDLSGMTLVLGKGAGITGRIVTDSEDSLLDWRRISLNMVPAGNITQMFFGGSGAALEEDFTFEIANLPEGPLSSCRQASVGESLCRLHPCRGSGHHGSSDRDEKQRPAGGGGGSRFFGRCWDQWLRRTGRGPGSGGRGNRPGVCRRPPTQGTSLALHPDDSDGPARTVFSGRIGSGRVSGVRPGRSRGRE